MTYEVSKNENDVVCASRQYTVTSINYYAKLDREGLKRMDCNKKTVVGTQYLSKNDWLLSSGTFDIRDFNKYGNPDDTPISYLLRYDPQLELKCQTYTMETKGWLKQKTTITASIIHEGIILEKLFLDSCTDEGIYIDKIGRYTYYNRHFTLEYKRKDKRCFIMGIDLAYNSPFKDVKVSRGDLHEFNCP
ncbi:uncharacterized protein LOC129003733 [Macrosteles quadrilineatus]|uniref:uncharacterized protein LOC129003733 n=1 Tax=Macrosteles quadrilineatus TaxID=74068 RepID=UPI0023E2D4AE|nr:uncharacterized protein LOC129003733 [Macrosteles quadrilineatus]